MIAVRIIPTSTPKIGLENMVNTPVKAGSLSSGATAPLIASMPNIRVEKPRRMEPSSFFFSLLQNI